MSQTRKSLIVLAAIAVIGFCQVAGQADPLVLSVANNSLTAVPGGSVTFAATITNTGASSTLTDTIATGGHIVLITSAGGPSVFGDFSAFDANFSSQLVTSGSSLGPLAFVTFTFPSNTPVGTHYFSTSARFVYYNTPGQFLFTNDVNLSVQIVAPTAPVPEPTTILLFGTGSVGIAAKVRKRRKAI